MSAPTITDLGQLGAAYQRSEQLLQEAAEAEHAAFVRWQEAYGAYEVACDDAADASSDVVHGHGWVSHGYSAADMDPASRGVGWLIAEGGTPPTHEGRLPHRRANHLDRRACCGAAHPRCAGPGDVDSEGTA